MKRKTQLLKEIKEWLEGEKFDGSIEGLQNLSNESIFDIDIECIENSDSYYATASIYKKVNKTKGYTIILSHEVSAFGKLESFVNYIIELEEEADNLILTLKD